MHYNTDIFDSEMLLGAGIMVVFQFMPLVLLIQIGFRIRSSHHDDDINDAPIPYCLIAIRLSLAGFLRFRDFLHSSCLRVVGLQLFHAVAFARLFYRNSEIAGISEMFVTPSHLNNFAVNQISSWRACLSLLWWQNVVFSSCQGAEKSSYSAWRSAVPL